MLKNYLVLFIRNLRRQKLFSAINLLGLSVSIASTLVIYLYVNHEYSYDRFHKNAERIYRVNQTFIWGENNNAQFASTGPGVAYAIHQELPEVELMTSLHTPGNFIVSYTNPKSDVISFEEKRVLAADSNFFQMFNFPLLKGDARSVFSQANTLVMTRSTAQKYFGDEEPLGKLVRLGSTSGENQQTYEVTGIVEDTPDNSYLEFDLLLSMKGFPIEKFYWSWVWTQLETYIRLSPTANVEEVRAKLSKIPEKHAGETLRLAFNTTWEEYVQSGKKWELFLQPLTQIHLPDELVLNRLNDSANITVIYSFMGAAIFIILLSCINFMNLSTAQFTRRLKEASVRKILGLGRKELGIGYFLEALTFCFGALILAVGLTQLLLPGFNSITGRSLQLNLVESPQILAGLLLLILIMAFASGIYPAFFLSSFNPVAAIKGKVKTGRAGKAFRDGLVVFQFSVSIVLMVCTAIVFQQLQFVADKDLGFNRENLLVVNHVEAVSAQESLTQSVTTIPGVAGASLCTSVPPRIWGGDTFGVQENSELRFPLNFLKADENYLTALQIKLKVGRNFLVNHPGDHERVLVNEATIRKIGWPVDETVIGKKLTYENATYEIIGVMADFNYWSLENPIEPMAVFHVKSQQLYPEPNHFIALRMEPQSHEQWEATMAQLQVMWKTYAGDTPFDFYFVEQAFAETFKSQQQFGTILTVMATLAILIAGLGLLGMIVYSLEQRTKEIGIRKVTGATVMDILVMISSGYTRLILFAFMAGSPFAYWLMHHWLQDFTYRIEPSLWIFAVIGLGTLFLASMITGYHSIKAALTNPVEVLKDE